MNVTICRATADDVGAISKLFNAYRVFFGQDSDLSLSEEFLRSHLTIPNPLFFVLITWRKIASVLLSFIRAFLRFQLSISGY